MLTTFHFFPTQHKQELRFFNNLILPYHVTYKEEQVGPEK